MTEAHAGGAYTPTFFARQPIFQTNNSVWGYELFYRDSPEAISAHVSDSESATMDVASSAFIHPVVTLDSRQVIVNFPRASILDNVPLALPSENVIIKLADSFLPDDQTITALSSFKQEGYRIAVDVHRKTPRALFELADYALLDLLRQDAITVNKLVQLSRSMGCTPIAQRVEDNDQKDLARDLGIDLVQGFFFQKPEMLPGRKLTSNEASRMNIFHILEKEDPNFDELASIVQTDVSISFRLLAYLNSASFGFPRKIESIKQAVVYLGWKKVRNWLRLIILSDLLPSNKSTELPYLSAVRGKFLEKVAMGHCIETFTPSAFFLLGLFSLLDTMLDMPMGSIVDTLPLDERLQIALEDDKAEHHAWLDLACNFEAGDWERLDATMTSLQLDPLIVARCYYDSLLWANSFFGNCGS